MKEVVVIGICLAVFLCGCASSQVKTSNQLKILSDLQLRLQRNMTSEEVVNLMGNPTRPIMIYFYLADEETNLLERLSKDNYTPLVFVDNKLAGWGWNFLNGAAKDMMSD